MTGVRQTQNGVVQTTGGVVDTSGGGDIPDSELLLARYDFSEEDGSMPVVDQTGNGHDLDQGSYTGVSESINSVQAGEFDGTDDGLWGPSFSDIRPVSVFTVVEEQGGGSQHNIVTLNATDLVTFWVNSGHWRLYTSESLSGTDDLSKNIIAGIIGGSNSSLREDGEETASGDGGDYGVTDIGIGSRQPWGTDRHWNGAIGEVLIYEAALSTSQISNVEDYLADKWNVTI